MATDGSRGKQTEEQTYVAWLVATSSLLSCRPTVVGNVLFLLCWFCVPLMDFCPSNYNY